MALSDFDSPDAWRLDLDNRWPERASLKRLVSDTLVQHCEASELRGTVRFLELGPGDGELLLLLQQRCPKADFAAADIQPTLLEFVAARAERPVTCVTADLSQAWSTLPGPYDVIYTMQAMHDLGGEAPLRHVYSEAFARLTPGGLLLNADFVQPMAHDDPDRPRRFPVTTHLELMRSVGFTHTWSAGEAGTLACVCATA